MTPAENAAKPLPSRPNIIFIMADDMGYGDLACYGATKIPTPNMDRIAREGIRFTDAHSASAVCTPSRYGVLTGRYCWRSRLKSGVFGGHAGPLIEEDRLTVAGLLKQNGYGTAAVGKWHLGLGWAWTSEERDDWKEDGSNIDYTQPLGDDPTTRGFDYFFGIAGSLDMPPYCFIENDHTVGVPTAEKETYYPQQRAGKTTPDFDDYEVDTTFAAKAVEYMRTTTRRLRTSPSSCT